MYAVLFQLGEQKFEMLTLPVKITAAAHFNSIVKQLGSRGQYKVVFDPSTLSNLNQHLSRKASFNWSWLDEYPLKYTVYRHAVITNVRPINASGAHWIPWKIYRYRIQSTDNLFFWITSLHQCGLGWSRVRIPTWAFKRFDLKSLPPHCVGICGPNPRYKRLGELDKLLKSHTASLRQNKSQNCDCHSNDDDDDDDDDDDEWALESINKATILYTVKLVKFKHHLSKWHRF